MTRLALAGIAAPILFTTLMLLQAWLQPDYSHIVWPISALAAWPYGWLQNVTFYVYGALVIAFAVGLHRGIRPTPLGGAGPALLALCGAGAIVAGLLPWELVAGVPTETPGHVLGAVMHFVGAALGLIVIARRMTRDPRWRTAAPFVLASGVAMLLLFVALAALGIPDDGPLHPWVGAVQRLAVAIWFVCLIALALRLRRQAAQGHDPSSVR